MRAIVAFAIAVAVAAPVATPAIAGPSAAQIQKRIDAAKKVYDRALSLYQGGTGTIDAVYTWSVRWLTAERETPLKGAKLKTAHGDHLARMQALEKTATDLAHTGKVATVDVEAAQYYVAEAEVWEARAK
jgi:hypothetical protein